MAALERVELFDRKSAFVFILFLFFMAFLSLGWEYYRYHEFTRFDDPLIRASVIDQEIRMIGNKPKTSIKFRLDNGAFVRCVMSPYLRDLRGRDVLLELYVKELSFWEYLKGFRARGNIEEVYPQLSLKERLYRRIASQHEESTMQELYGALFVATPMTQEFQQLIGAMGLSAAISISGYHFGILSAIAFFLLRPVYRTVQNRYFPYRHGNRDLYLFILTLMGVYLWALEFNPAMVRSFGMLAVGYWLYDRGVKIVSIQTLLIAVGVLLAFFPRLFFSMGFWFSVFGVWSIFIFIRYYGHWKAWQIFLALNVWCFLVMLPLGLAIFGTFGWWYAGSVGLNLVFNLYYPLVLALHSVARGDVLDPYLLKMFDSAEVFKVVIPEWVAAMSVIIAIAAMRWKGAFWLLGGVGLITFGSAVYQIA
ncbi:MAG: ComEC/Rec2 family competence protein [Sulfuricurvum sp.]